MMIKLAERDNSRQLLKKDSRQMIKAAIFDLDGTLAYTLPDLTEGLNRTRERFGLDRITANDTLKFINGTTAQFIRSCFPEGMDEQYYSDAVNTYIDEYSKCFLDNTTAYDGLSETLGILKRSGVRLAVLTNKDNRHANTIVNKLFGGDVFETVIGTGRFPGKPDPTSSLYIADMFSAKPCEIVFIGDSDVDVITAKNAGMIALDVSWGYRSEDILLEAGADHIAHKPEDIIKIIGQINSATE